MIGFPSSLKLPQYSKLVKSCIHFNFCVLFDAAAKISWNNKNKVIKKYGLVFMRLIVTLPRQLLLLGPFSIFFNLMLVAAGLVALFGISSVFNQGVVALGKKNQV
jgi:hypothetical protein